MKIKNTEFARQARKYIGTRYANPPAGMKCDSLVEACLTDAGYPCNWAGTNTMARSGVFSWLGTPEECRKAFGMIPVGACPMIWTDDGGEPEKYRGDGIGNYSHIGIRMDDGLTAIHASSSKGGVCESVFKDKTIPNGGWNRVALLSMVDYGDAINGMLEHKEEQTMIDTTTNAVIWSANGKGVNFRKEPSTSSAAWASLLPGTKINVLATGSTWSRVQYDGKTGYIMAEFIRLEQPTGNSSGTDLEARVKVLEEKLERLETEWEMKMGWG